MNRQARINRGRLVYRDGVAVGLSEIGEVSCEFFCIKMP